MIYLTEFANTLVCANMKELEGIRSMVEKEIQSRTLSHNILSRETINELNRKIHEITYNTFFPKPTKAWDLIIDACVAMPNGLVFKDEVNAVIHYLSHGRFEVGVINAAGAADTMLVFSWHQVPNGNYSVTAYLS